jgi:hypothetical protein
MFARMNDEEIEKYWERKKRVLYISSEKEEQS